MQAHMAKPMVVSPPCRAGRDHAKDPPGETVTATVYVPQRRLRKYGLKLSSFTPLTRFIPGHRRSVVQTGAWKEATLYFLHVPPRSASEGWLAWRNSRHGYGPE
jgi:hypothetical protein